MCKAEQISTNKGKVSERLPANAPTRGLEAKFVPETASRIRQIEKESKEYTKLLPHFLLCNL